MFDMMPSSTDFVDSTTFDLAQPKSNGPMSTTETNALSPDTNGLHPLSSTTIGSPQGSNNHGPSSSTLITLTANNSHLGSFDHCLGVNNFLGGGMNGLITGSHLMGSGSHLQHPQNPLGSWCMLIHDSF